MTISIVFYFHNFQLGQKMLVYSSFIKTNKLNVIFKYATESITPQVMKRIMGNWDNRLKYIPKAPIN